MSDSLRLNVNSHSDHHSSPYRSAFRHWHQRASVRSRPSRDDDSGHAGLYFPPELFTPAGHPLVQELGPAAVDDLLIQRLYSYLSFTVELEEVAVIPVTSSLGRGLVQMELTTAMRSDAMKISTDEAYHSLFTFDLMTQITERTGVIPDLPATPFIRPVAEFAPEGLSALSAALLPVMFAVVTETAITGILSGMPQDTRLPAIVRDVIRDHAEDEGRHHVYFRDLLRRNWPRLGPVQQRELGTIIPSMIAQFLAPDVRQAHRLLLGAGLRPAQAGAVLEDCYPRAERVRITQKASAQTVGYFLEVGALDIAQVQDAFGATALTPEAGHDRDQ